MNNFIQNIRASSFITQSSDFIKNKVNELTPAQKRTMIVATAVFALLATLLFFMVRRLKAKKNDSELNNNPNNSNIQNSNNNGSTIPQAPPLPQTINSDNSNIQNNSDNSNTQNSNNNGSTIPQAPQPNVIVQKKQLPRATQTDTNNNQNKDSKFSTIGTANPKSTLSNQNNNNGPAIPFMDLKVIGNIKLKPTETNKKTFTVNATNPFGGKLKPTKK